MLDGWMENALVNEPATAVEDRYREILRASRARDAAAGRTLDGPHLTDLQVIYAPKNMPARDASTGEQKALLIGLVLAHASLVAEMTGITPLLLLDEVVAHLDPGRRRSLFDRTRKTRLAGLDDRRRPRGIRRHRRIGRSFRGRFRPDHPPRLTARTDPIEPQAPPARLDISRCAMTSPPSLPRDRKSGAGLANTGDHMFETTRGMLVPAGKRLLPLLFALIAAAPMPRGPTTAWSMSAPCRAWKAPWKRWRAPNPIV